MRSLLSVSLIVVLSAASVAAPVKAADKMEGMDHKDRAAMSAQSSADANLDDAVVKKVDKAGGKVTLSHGPLRNGMPAMTMSYKVKSPEMLDQVKEGQKVRFTADDSMSVVRLEAAK